MKRSDHLSPALVTEAKLLVTEYPKTSPFSNRDAFVRAIVMRWTNPFEPSFRYDEKKTAALRKKARRYLRAALSELYPTRMFLRKAKHNLRFSVLKLKNSFDSKTEPVDISRDYEALVRNGWNKVELRIAGHEEPFVWVIVVRHVNVYVRIKETSECGWTWFEWFVLSKDWNRDVQTASVTLV